MLLRTDALKQSKELWAGRSASNENIGPKNDSCKRWHKRTTSTRNKPPERKWATSLKSNTKNGAIQTHSHGTIGPARMLQAHNTEACTVSRQQDQLLHGTTSGDVNSASMSQRETPNRKLHHDRRQADMTLPSGTHRQNPNRRAGRIRKPSHRLA